MRTALVASNEAEDCLCIRNPTHKLPSPSVFPEFPSVLLQSVKSTPQVPQHNEDQADHNASQ
jgi:hypothetical protein